jgi:hypothetical protein
MTESELLNKMIRVLRQPSLPVYIGSVKSIESNKTCTVIFPDKFELTGVRLKAAIDEKEEFVYVIPKVGSSVLLGSLSNIESDGEFYVIACNEVASLQGVIDKTKFLIDKTQVSASVDESSVLLKADEITLNQDGTKVTLKAEKANIHGKAKVSIKTDRGALKQLLLNISTFLKNIKVLTGSPGSPSPIHPTLLSDILQIDDYINDIFE